MSYFLSLYTLYRDTEHEYTTKRNVKVTIVI